MTQLQRENKTLSGLLASASPEILEELKAKNKELKAALIQIEKDLAAELARRKNPLDAAGISDKLQVLKSEVLAYCADRKLDPSPMEKARILVIEDNQDTRQFLETVLSREYEVYCAENAILGIDYARNKRPDLIILDIMLPILSGFDACAMLKKDEITKNIPIIFLSAKNTVADITQGLGLGADDYLSKPFDYKELMARVKVRLREKAIYKSEPKVVMHGDLKLVFDTRDAFYAGKPVELTQTEFDLLRLLVQRLGQVVNREEIIQAIWKSPPDATQKRTIDVHIRALRKKIPALTRHVISVYGVGYKYEPSSLF